MWVPSLGQEDPLQKEMATGSSTLAWEIQWTEEPGRLQPMRLQKSQTKLGDSTTIFMYTCHNFPIRLFPDQIINFPGQVVFYSCHSFAKYFLK